ncbi:hypothetical protein ACTXT7_010766 [Hymenolepis weldensis]
MVTRVYLGCNLIKFVTLRYAISSWFYGLHKKERIEVEKSTTLISPPSITTDYREQEFAQ